MNIVWWLIIGLIAGLIARALMPGDDSMGVLATMVLGLVGSVIGGFIADVVAGGDQDFSPAGLIGSIIGAMIALLLMRMLAGGSRAVG
ncbi:MAG: GlsB/YeaQ/YmgE family stress response membrane protein [Actinomycetota bacterium]